MFVSHRVIIDQHFNGLPPAALIHINSKVVEPNLALLPHVSEQEDFHRGSPSGVRERAPTDQAQEAMTPKAPEITPQSPIVDPAPLALLAEEGGSRRN